MKRKEKPLTLEQIKTKLIEQNLPNWIHSAPMLAIAPSAEGPKVLTLSEQAEKELMLLFMIDLTRYTAETVLECLDRLCREYKSLPIQPILVIEPGYLFLREPHFLDRFRSFKSFSTLPVIFDSKGDWFDLFKVQEGMILLLSRGMEVVRLPLFPNPAEQISKAELTLQDGLRMDDPGLPLFPVKPQNFTHKPDLRVIPARELNTSGTWITSTGSILTEDSNAQISFFTEACHLRLVATSHPNSREPTRFVITVNDEPIPSVHYGSSTKLGEKGSSISEVGKSQGVYELISSPTPIRGEIRIKFLNAVENPVIIYGFRAA